MTTTMNTGAASLLPCPFCGSKNTTIGYSGQPARAVFAMCSACGASGPVQAFQRGMTFDWEECWNRRATPQADAAIAAGGAQEAVAWVRYRSDGGFEGPIMDTDARMCDTRRSFWTPLCHVAATVGMTDDVRSALESCAATYEINGLGNTAAGIRALLAASNGEQA